MAIIPLGELEVKQSKVIPLDQLEAADRRRGKFIPQFTNALYENVPFGKRVISMMPNAAQIEANMKSTPEATTVREQVGRGFGEALPVIATAAPFIEAAGALPFIGKSAIVSGALGFGGYGATKAALEGKPAGEIAGEAGASALSGAAFGIGGRIGTQATDAVARKLIQGGINPLAAKALLSIAPRVGSAVGMGAAGAMMAPKGEKISNAIVGGGLGLVSPTAPFRPNIDKMIAKHADVYREVLAPTKGEIGKVEVRQGRDLNEFYKLAAKEGLVIKSSPDKKIDTTDARASLSSKTEELNSRISEMISQAKGDKHFFSLDEIADKAKNGLRKKIKNDAEYEALVAQVDKEIDAAKENRAQYIDASELNVIKQGMWSKSYNPLEPNSKIAAREIGFVAKDAIEKAFPDKDIRGVNRKLGDYLTLDTLLENAHGRVIQRGKLGKYAAELIGAGIGHTTGVPVIGELGGAWLGAKTHEIATSPERITSAMAKKLQKASDVSRYGTMPAQRDVSGINPEIVDNAPSLVRPQGSLTFNPLNPITRTDRMLPSPKEAGSSSGPTIYGKDWTTPNADPYGFLAEAKKAYFENKEFKMPSSYEVENARPIAAGEGRPDITWAEALRQLKDSTKSKDVAKKAEAMARKFEAKEQGQAPLNNPITSEFNPLKTQGEQVRENPMKKGLRSKQGSTVTGKAVQDLTTKVLKRLGDRETVSKQFIADLTNSPDLKQIERELIRSTLEKHGDKVNVKKFTEDVKAQLTPLKMNNQQIMGRSWEHINLPDELRGPVQNYAEHVYESPIKTSAGDQHFKKSTYPNYFAHARVEDLPADPKSLSGMTGKDLSGKWSKNQLKALPKGDTRRILEIQSDLFQKGGLEGQNQYIEAPNATDVAMRKKYMKKMETRDKELAPLRPFENTWHERVIREEIAQAAKDGKTKLQFPTGETAMKIEGLTGAESTHVWSNMSEGKPNAGIDLTDNLHTLKVGARLLNEHTQDSWIVTKVLGDGRFSATPEIKINDLSKLTGMSIKRLLEKEAVVYQETFDASGKVDVNDPIYRFYDKEVAKYLKRIAPDMQQITDNQGVTWNQIDVPKEQASNPIEAFGVLAPLGLTTAAVLGGAAVGNAASQKVEQGQEFEGKASTYGWGEKLNKFTFGGEVFKPDGVTAAMRNVPMGTKVEITDPRTGKKVIATVNDGGPGKRLNRVIDLSKGAWKELGYGKPGLVDVKVRILELGKGRAYNGKY